MYVYRYVFFFLALDDVDMYECIPIFVYTYMHVSSVLYMCPLTIYVSSYYMCPLYYVCVSSLLYMCPPYYICVLFTTGNTCTPALTFDVP